MSHITIPEGYQSLLGLYDTQKAIGLIKTIFQRSSSDVAQTASTMSRTVSCRNSSVRWSAVITRSPVCHAGQRPER